MTARPPPAEKAPDTGAIPSASLLRHGWQKLREMRTVFRLLCVIAAAALLCAVIPQGEAPEQYYERYGRFLGNVITRLALHHVHTAWWFLSLLGLLLLSLVACAGRLWVQARRRWCLPEAAEALRETHRGAAQATAQLSPEHAARRAGLIARHRGYRLHTLGTVDGQTVLCATRHRCSAWGPALAHYAVFLIALGAILGNLPGLSVDTLVQVAEGTTYQASQSAAANGRAAGSADAPAARLPFDIRVERFEIDEDPQTGEVRNYYSEVRLLESGREVAAGTVAVNHPLRYRGYLLTQTSWGLGEALIEAKRGGRTEQLRLCLLRAGTPEWGTALEDRYAAFADGKGALVSGGFEGNAVREGKELYVASEEDRGQPALNLSYARSRPGRPMPYDLRDLGWLLPGESRPIPGGTVTFTAVTRSTGLGVRRDPGLPLVWAGFAVCVLGLSLIFYFPLQRYVLVIAPEGEGSSRIRLAAHARPGTAAGEQTPLWTVLLKQLPATPELDGGDPSSE